MKKVLFLLTIALATVTLQAQKLDKAKDLLTKNKLADAQKEIDALLAIEKNKTSSEAWYIKGKVYNAISNDAALKATVPDARNTAFESLKQYVELESKVKDSTKRNISLLVDNNQPFVDIYRGYSADGATFYNANNFNDAYTNFVKTLDVFDFISQKKIIPLQFDTTTVLYAGISAEKANNMDNAAMQYSKIAERKIKSEGYIEIYKWLADYYGKKSDVAKASQFTAIGREVYPGDQFWDAFDLEIAREKGTKDDLFKKYEQVIAGNPTNHLFIFNYGVELYQIGYNQDIKQRPANSKELIAKAGEQFKKVIQLKPDYPNAQIAYGQLVYNEGVDISNINKEIRPPAGGKLKPEELKKKEDLRKEIAVKFDQALPYFQKVEEILGKQGKLKMEDKLTLKEAYDLIITIYENRQDKDKAEEYTVKFNEVDKKHS